MTSVSNNESPFVFTPFQNGVLGASLGATEPLFSQPLTVIKQELQKGNRVPRSPQVLWAGARVNSSYMTIVTPLQFAFDRAVKNMLSDNGKKELSSAQSLCCSLLSGAATSPIAAFMETVMVQFSEKMKAWKDNPSLPKPTYKSTVNDIYAKWGPFGYLRGLVGVAVRDAKFTGSVFFLAPEIQKTIFQYMGNSPFAPVVSGAVAGVIGAVSSHPWDTWKTRRQADLPTTFKEGIVNGWKGCLARSARAAFAVSYFHTGTELVTEMFKKLTIADK